jgi:DNA-binding XRE family transcriptional regulator
VLTSVGSTGFEYRAVTGFWDAFVQPSPKRKIPERMLVMADLANIVRHFQSADRPSWVASVRMARPYFVAFVRTERDKGCAALIDDLMRHCDQRLTVCSDPVRTEELESCITEAFVALEPDSIADVRYVARTGSFWIEFRDGLVGTVTLDDLGIADLRNELVLESATLGEWGKTLVLGRTDRTPFEVDASSVRAVLDSHFADRLRRASGESSGSVGARLRSAREAAGVTQTELGRRAGFDQAVISKLERGRHDPRIDTLRRLAEALDLSLPGMLLGEG